MSVATVYVELPPEGAASWREPVSTATALPATASLGDARVAQDTSIIYVWTGSAWQAAGGGGGGGITSINADTTAAQLIVAATTGTDVTVTTAAGTTTIAIPSASATARGVVTTGAQTIAGAKTFSSTIVGSASLNVLKAGDTMTGPLIFPIGSTPEIVGLPTAGANAVGGDLTVAAGNGTGTGGSGAINLQTAPAAASSSTANTLSTRALINKFGMSVGGSVPSTSLSAARTFVVKGSSGSTITEIAIEAENNTASFGMQYYTTGGVFQLVNAGVQFFSAHVSTTNMTFGYNASGNRFPFTMAAGSSSTNPGAMVSGGSSVLPPSFTTLNSNSTAGNYGEFANAGSSGKLNGYMAFYNDVQTSSSEDSHWALATAAAGSLTEKLTVSKLGQVAIQAAGVGLSIKEGSNCKQGASVLVGGTVTVSTTAVTASSRIQLTGNVDGGTPGWVRVSARNAGSDFTITSSSGSDTSTVAWFITEPS